MTAQASVDRIAVSAQAARTPTRIRLWDLPVRVFHWSLVLAVATAVVTGELGGSWMELHGKAGLSIVGLVVLSRCALYSDVSIGPLVLTPAKLERGADIQQMIKKADYLRALEMAPAIEGRQRKNAADLVSLGYAELAADRVAPCDLGL